VLSAVAANGSRLGEGRAFENRQPKLSTNVDRITNAQLLPSVLLLPNRCWWQFIFFLSILVLSKLDYQEQKSRFVF